MRQPPGRGPQPSDDAQHVVLVAPAPVLQVEDEPKRTYQLKLGGNVVGRGGGSDFKLNDTGVSRKHIAITWDGTRAVLTDLGSLNGVTVNGAPVQERSLADGDVIQIGHSTLVFRTGSTTEERLGPHDQEAQDVSQLRLTSSRLRRVDSSITIYTSSDDGQSLQDALVGLLDVSGFDVTAYGEPERGSWFRRLHIRSRDSGAGDKLVELLSKAERAAELKYINTPRSDNDEREANAIARLAQAMENMDEVVIRTSSILFIKTGGQVLAWVLSEEELRILDDNPHLMKSPKEILDFLPKLRQESIRRSGDGELPSPVLEKGRSASAVRVPPSQSP